MSQLTQSKLTNVELDKIADACKKILVHPINIFSSEELKNKYTKSQCNIMANEFLNLKEYLYSICKAGEILSMIQTIKGVKQPKGW